MIAISNLAWTALSALALALPNESALQDPSGRGWIGINLGVEATTGRPFVEEVIPGSPAESVGLKIGDLILSVGDVLTPDDITLERQMIGRKPGESIVMRVRRSVRTRSNIVSRDLDVRITLGEHPEYPSSSTKAETGESGATKGTGGAAGAEAKEDEGKGGAGSTGGAPAGETAPLPSEAIPTGTPFLGLNLVEQLASVNKPAGLLVEEVFADSPAERAGLEAGALVVRIDDEPVRTIDELDLVMVDWAPGKTIVLATWDATKAKAGQRTVHSLTLEPLEAWEARRVARARGLPVEAPGDTAASATSAEPAERRPEVPDVEVRMPEVAPPVLGPALIVFSNLDNDAGRRQKLVLDDPAVRRAREQWGMRIEWIEGASQRPYLDGVGVEGLPCVVAIDGKDELVEIYRGYQPAERLARQARSLWRVVRDQWEAEQRARREARERALAAPVVQEVPEVSDPEVTEEVLDSAIEEIAAEPVLEETVESEAGDRRDLQPAPPGLPAPTASGVPGPGAPVPEAPGPEAPGPGAAGPVAGVSTPEATTPEATTPEAIDAGPTDAAPSNAPEPLRPRAAMEPAVAAGESPTTPRERALQSEVRALRGQVDRLQSQLDEIRALLQRAVGAPAAPATQKPGAAASGKAVDQPVPAEVKPSKPASKPAGAGSSGGSSSPGAAGQAEPEPAGTGL